MHKHFSQQSSNMLKNFLA